VIIKNVSKEILLILVQVARVNQLQVVVGVGDQRLYGQLVEHVVAIVSTGAQYATEKMNILAVDVEVQEMNLNKFCISTRLA
jgi:N-acyl-L-homoserine lactone synthetase